MGKLALVQEAVAPRKKAWAAWAVDLSKAELLVHAIQWEVCVVVATPWKAYAAGAWVAAKVLAAWVWAVWIKAALAPAWAIAWVQAQLALALDLAVGKMGAAQAAVVKELGFLIRAAVSKAALVLA